MTDQKQNVIDKDCIKKAINIVMKEDNNWIINTNKKYHTAINTVKDTNIKEYINKCKDPNDLIRCLIVTAQLINKIYEQQRK